MGTRPLDSETLGQLPSQHYARLADHVVVNRSPTYGTVVDEAAGGVSRVTRPVWEILAECDGTRTVGDLIADRARDLDEEGETGLFETVIELVRLARTRRLLLEEQPRPSPPRITGDPDIYYPTALQTELTTACNLLCSYCYRQAGPAGEARLGTAELLRILAELIELGLLSVELTGGEPLVHPDFMRILAFCGERLALVGLLTNGTLLTADRVQQMAGFREKMVVSVSLDSHIAEKHDRRRGRPGAFRATCDGIRRLADAGFRTRVTITVDEDNWPDLEPTLLLARDLGAMSFTYAPVLPLGRGSEGFSLWAHDAREVAAVERAIREKYGDFMHLYPQDEVEEIRRPGGCGAGHRTYAMDPVGRIRPCVTFDPDMAVFGSLRTSSPKEVFGNEMARAFARAIAPQPSACEGCDYGVFCQNCLLRGLIAREWISDGGCGWLRMPEITRWQELVQANTIAEGAP